MYTHDEIKDLNHIQKFFDIKPEGNWENKIILVEKEKLSDEILENFYQLDQKEKAIF